jgi:hypothetical protein
MTMEMIVLLSLLTWFLVIPSAVVGLRLRRARLAKAVSLPASPLRRACEGRRRLVWTSRARERAKRPI